MQRVVVFCGGRGSRTILSALLERGDCRVTAVVNPFDDGKSTGEIRRVFGMPGPSDLRKNLEVMLGDDHPDAAAFRRIFAFRYPQQTDHNAAVDDLVSFALGEGALLPGLEITDEGTSWVLRRLVEGFVAGAARKQFARGERFEFGDCSLVNCLFAGAWEILDRDFEQAAAMLGRLFRVKGRVLPTTGRDLKLVALRKNGELVPSEAGIVTEASGIPIEELFLLEEYPDPVAFGALAPARRREFLAAANQVAAASDEVVSALSRADLIIYGPGTQHSSLYPTYRTRGIPTAIAANRKAAKVLVTNIAVDADIPGFTAADIVSGAIYHLAVGGQGRQPVSDLIDHVLVNLPGAARPDQVEPDPGRLRRIAPAIIEGQFEDVRDRGRHDGRQVLEACLEVMRGSLVDRTVRLTTSPAAPW